MRMRKAIPSDLDYLVRIDLKDEVSFFNTSSLSAEEMRLHQEKISKFVSSSDRGAKKGHLAATAAPEWPFDRTVNLNPSLSRAPLPSPSC
ncbi:hypothetical protein [Paenibacillus vulneris]|uniref:N-acetyltransferase domain-containing protein n=1 Tax=Paenibacillus vulneris TaxID=1133364 RepID=A0ABW3UVJ3_9BACL